MKTKQKFAVHWCVMKRERWAGRGINDVSVVFCTLHVIKTCFFHTIFFISLQLFWFSFDLCTYTKYTKYKFSFISTTAPWTTKKILIFRACCFILFINREFSTNFLNFPRFFWFIVSNIDRGNWIEGANKWNKIYSIT